jgi:hypothetical protein
LDAIRGILEDSPVEADCRARIEWPTIVWRPNDRIYPALYLPWIVWIPAASIFIALILAVQAIL